jgi:DNA polymerase III subunit delta'
MLAAAESTGARAGEETVERLAAAAADVGQDEGRAGRRAARDAEEAGRRSSRRARTEALDTGLGLLAAQLRDLAAVADGAEDLVLNTDRLDELRAAATGLDARAARRGGEIVMDTRRRLTVNVGEELALEALVYRLEALFSSQRSRD